MYARFRNRRNLFDGIDFWVAVVRLAWAILPDVCLSGISLGRDSQLAIDFR
jgi:hypothetical protein